MSWYNATGIRVEAIERAQPGDFIIREEAGFRVMAGGEFSKMYNAKSVSQ